MRIRITPYAEGSIHSRKLDRQHVMQVAANPEQIAPATGNRFFAQSKYEQEGKTFLLRVLLEEIGDERWIVTVYPTSKVEKYWLGGNDESNI